MVATLVLEASAERRVGSSPTWGTKKPGLLFYVIKQRPLNDRRGGTLGLDLTVPLTWDTENCLG